jgi:hypothetical protein
LRSATFVGASFLALSETATAQAISENYQTSMVNINIGNFYVSDFSGLKFVGSEKDLKILEKLKEVGQVKIMGGVIEFPNKDFSAIRLNIEPKARVKFSIDSNIFQSNVFQTGNFHNQHFILNLEMNPKDVKECYVNGKGNTNLDKGKVESVVFKCAFKF